MTNFYFILLLIPAIVLYYIADKRNNKLFLFMATIYISLIVGLRGINVGIDTMPYYNAFLNDFPIKWQFEETGFREISRFLMKIFKNPSFLFVIYAFFTNLLISLRLWDFRKKCNFSVMVFLYLFIYLFDIMNIMRQFISIAIVFYSTRFLDKKKYILFFLIVIFASQIHKTALLSLVYILIYYWDKLTKKQKYLLAIPLIFMSVVGLKYVIQYESDHINNYFSSNSVIDNFNITFMYRLFVFVFSYVLYRSNIKIIVNGKLKENKKIENNDKEIENNDREIKIISIIYLLGLLFSSMGMFYNYMTRIGLYYLCYELLYWGYMTKKSKNKFLNFSFIFIYAIYVFIIELVYNGSQIFPYYIVF